MRGRIVIITKALGLVSFIEDYSHANLLLGSSSVGDDDDYKGGKGGFGESYEGLDGSWEGLTPVP